MGCLTCAACPAVLAGKRRIQRQLAQDKTFLEQLCSAGFIPLGDNAERREVVFGLIGQFWKLSGGEGVKAPTQQHSAISKKPVLPRSQPICSFRIWGVKPCFQPGR